MKKHIESRHKIINWSKEEWNFLRDRFERKAHVLIISLPSSRRNERLTIFPLPERRFIHKSSSWHMRQEKVSSQVGLRAMVFTRKFISLWISVMLSKILFGKIYQIKQSYQHSLGHTVFIACELFGDRVLLSFLGHTETESIRPLTFASRSTINWGQLSLKAPVKDRHLDFMQSILSYDILKKITLSSQVQNPDMTSSDSPFIVNP